MKSIIPSLVLSSGDPVLDRRLEWACGLLERGEAAAAADLIRETLEQKPDFLAGHFLLGEVLEAVGKREAAAEAFRRAAALDPSDCLGAQLRLAKLGARSGTGAMSMNYVRNLFDQYAARFDLELAGPLSYRGPELLLAAIRRVAGEQKFSCVLDLGCGTGLTGEAVRADAGELVGVDLSPAMIDAARRKNIYDRLEAAELLEFLRRAHGPFDLVLAADVFVYLDSLHPVFAAIAPIANGIIAFTVETHAGDNVILRETLRYAHGEMHLRAAARAAGLEILLLEKASTRTEKGKPVEGLLAVLSRAGK